MYHLKGDNGSGKSVLCRIIANIEKEYQGEIKSEIKPSRTLYLGNDSIAFPFLTVLENIDIFQGVYGIQIDRFFINKLYDKDQLNRISKDASLGMNMKVGLSLLFTKTFWQLIILDETLTNVDENSKKLIFEELNKRKNEGSVIIITNHQDLSEYENNIQTIFLNNGEIND